MAQVTVRTFGKLDHFFDVRPFEVDDNATINELLDVIEQDYFGVRLEVYRIAVDGEFVEKDFSLKDGQEVVLMPPFSGG